MISTRGRYAIRVLLDLAEHRGEAFTPMKEVARRQEISLKYLEKIMPLLSKANMVEGQHGKGGGYRLTMEPENYRIGDILRLTEVDLAPVACLSAPSNTCPRAPYCRTLPMWQKYYEMTLSYFDSVTIRDLMQVESGGDYVI